MSRISVFVIAALGALALSRSPATADEFKSLFNGKDLSGWEGDTTLWSVKDGAIVGKTEGKSHTFLIWKGTAADFELHAKFRLHGGNSGIQYRSKQVKSAGAFVVGGYQADMDADNTYTGILYEERGRGILAQRGQKVVIAANGAKHVVGSTGDPKKLAAAIKPGEWNDYVIVASGNKLTQAINGQPMIEVIDLQVAKRALDGIIALQLHKGYVMTVEFKDIQLKTLPPGKILSAQEAPIPSGATKKN